MSPGRPDPSLVRRHLLALDSALRQLRKHQGRPLEDQTLNLDEAWAVERGLQLCAQNALDIATHLAATAGHDVPDYGAAIDRLADMGVLPGEFVSRFRGVAGFRNVIVHAYLDVDVAAVHRLLNDRLDDFAVFARHVSAYIDSRC